MESYGLGTAATAIAPNFRPDTLTKQTPGRMKHLEGPPTAARLSDLIFCYCHDTTV